ncbi:hypothetical protein VTN02DRAFT_5998 [Thermoascus thermophilus]
MGSDLDAEDGKPARCSQRRGWRREREEEETTERPGGRTQDGGWGWRMEDGGNTAVDARRQGRLWGSVGGRGLDKQRWRGLAGWSTVVSRSPSPVPPPAETHYPLARSSRLDPLCAPPDPLLSPCALPVACSPSLVRPLFCVALRCCAARPSCSRASPSKSIPSALAKSVSAPYRRRAWPRPRARRSR